MNKRKLLRKMAIPAAVVFTVAVLVMLSSQPYRIVQNKNRVEKLNAHLTKLTQDNQQFLSETAKKIADAAGGITDFAALQNSGVVREIQSQILLEHQKVDQIKKYLWMSDPAGEFVFGAPTFAFDKTNAGFDKFREIITGSTNYRNRNDFLMNMIDKHDQIDYSQLDINKLPGEKNDAWDNREWYYTRPRTMLLSAPVLDPAGNARGTLFLKIDDSVNHALYFTDNASYSRDIYDNFILPFFGIIAFFSGLFLWFLLPTWVYIDAQQRDVSNPGLWAFITLISLVFGLAIYLITRPSAMKSLTCPKCENELNGGGAFCPHCGFDLSSTYCQKCQYPIKPEWAFCPNCRSELQETKQFESPAEQKKEQKIET